MAVSTVIWGPIVVLSFPLPFTHRYRISQQWSRFNTWWLKKTCRIDYQLEGLENLSSEPVVVLAKHQSTWETLFLHQFLPPLSWVVKRELLWIPFFGWALALIRPIAINRATAKAAMKQVLHQGRNRLENGQSVLIFPEGTRMAPGARGHYHGGGALLATRSGYPILPLTHNAGIYWPRHSFIKYPGTIQLVFGPVIDSQGKSAKIINTQIEEWIETVSAQLINPPNPVN
ncbi:MAG: lysophospholipid acyltransferase family protein [Candidatus Competibacteraceae bacterium]